MTAAGPEAQSPETSPRAIVSACKNARSSTGPSTRPSTSGAGLKPSARIAQPMMPAPTTTQTSKRLLLSAYAATTQSTSTPGMRKRGGTVATRAKTPTSGRLSTSSITLPT